MIPSLVDVFISFFSHRFRCIIVILSGHQKHWNVHQWPSKTQKCSLPLCNITASLLTSPPLRWFRLHGNSTTCSVPQLSPSAKNPGLRFPTQENTKRYEWNMEFFFFFFLHTLMQLYILYKRTSTGTYKKWKLVCDRKIYLSKLIFLEKEGNWWWEGMISQGKHYKNASLVLSKPKYIAYFNTRLQNLQTCLNDIAGVIVHLFVV